jgi:hypothetical protein
VMKKSIGAEPRSAFEFIAIARGDRRLHAGAGNAYGRGVGRSEAVRSLCAYGFSSVSGCSSSIR